MQNRKFFTYEEYRALVTKLLSSNSTTGPNQTAEMIDYTILNAKRTQRIEKTVQIEAAVVSQLNNIVQQHWIVLCEAWCGDVAQNLPIISKMAEETGQVTLSILLRDENLDIMDAFLTKNCRAIPKLIALDDAGEILFTWGPRPIIMQEVAMRLKKEGKPYTEEIHLMYARDRGKSIQEEFGQLLQKFSV